MTNQSRYQIELTCVDALVPENHLLREIERHIDFSFIREKTMPFYNETLGRPPIDPVRLFKMMLIGYLYGIRSERQLEQEIITNVAYRWFLGLGLSDRVPDHSTISYNRTNRFKGTNIFQEIFDEIVRMAIEHGMVGGRLLATDSTHIKANANKNRYAMQEVKQTPGEYLQELEAAVNKDREDHGKGPLPPAKTETETKNHKVSITDPESGYLMRKGKPEMFAYLEHRTVDHKAGIITDSYVTPGNFSDSVVYVERLHRQIKTFGFQDSLEAVTLDSGYMTPYICMKTAKMGITAVIGGRNAPTKDGVIPKSEFVYDREQDQYICPKGQALKYHTTTRGGYRDYQSDPAVCSLCPLLDQCTTNKANVRSVQRHVWEDFKEQVMQYSQSDTGKVVYKIRSQTIERSFAEAKELHGLRTARLRGKDNMQEQTLMTAIAQNVKKIVKRLGKRLASGTFDGCRVFISHLQKFAYWNNKRVTA